MRIGYSAWGFCGEGVVDSPDGGRLTRSLFISSLIQQGHEVTWLQMNRDLDSSGSPIFSLENRTRCGGQESILCDMKYDEGFPEIDILFLEWRWPIPGRNCLNDPSKWDHYSAKTMAKFPILTDKSDPNFTPDLDRQTELLSNYMNSNRARRPMIVIWDKDETMTYEDENKLSYHKSDVSRTPVMILSPALHPVSNLFPRQTLLFPCDLNEIRGAQVNDKIEHLIGYVGSQYERDHQVYQYIVPFNCDFFANRHDFMNGHSITHPTIFAGNWTKTPDKLKRNMFNFPGILFKDRILPMQMGFIYGKCLSTLLMCKSNYSAHGHITQRIHEVPAHGVIALGLREQVGIESFIIEDNIISDAFDLKKRILELLKMNLSERQSILDQQIEMLKPFDIEEVMKRFEWVVLGSM